MTIPKESLVMYRSSFHCIYFSCINMDLLYTVLVNARPIRKISLEKLCELAMVISNIMNL